jgi:hypothetical protein
MPKFDKIKHSRHQREQMAKDPGHVCTEAEAESIIDSPLATCVQEEDGRRKYWGLGRGDKIMRLSCLLRFPPSHGSPALSLRTVTDCPKNSFPAHRPSADAHHGPPGGRT